MSANPVIIIPGIGQSKLILAGKNGKKIKNAWPVELDEKKFMNDIKGPLMSMLLFKKDGGFSDKVAGIVNDITEPLAVNEDGTKKHNIIPVSYNKPLSECTPDEKRFIYKMVPLEQLGERIGEDRLFYFAFDPFGDIYDTADSLASFADMAKAKTGAEKVDFIAVSIGGVVLKAYLQKYASRDDVGKIVNVMSVLDGMSLVADLFEDNFADIDIVRLLMSAGGTARSLASMAKMMPADIMEKTVEKSLETAKSNLLYSCTTLWGAVPSSRFDAIYSDRFASSGNGILSSKVKAVHSFDFSQVNGGVKFFNICGYGSPLANGICASNADSDGVVDVSSASLGAASSGVGSEPDETKCAFPDTTWFFKNQKHSAASYNDVILSLVTEIITGGVRDVRDNPKYPQFNGTRNIKKLKYELIPKAENALANADEASAAKIRECIDEYENMLKNTILTDNTQTEALEKRITEALENINI